MNIFTLLLSDEEKQNLCIIENSTHYLFAVLGGLILQLISLCILKFQLIDNALTGGKNSKELPKAKCLQIGGAIMTFYAICGYLNQASNLREKNAQAGNNISELNLDVIFNAIVVTVALMRLIKLIIAKQSATAVQELEQADII